jgi:hypothetical protein
MTPNSVRIKNALTVSNGVSISGNVVISNGQLVVGGTAINSTSVSEAANNAYTNATIFSANASNANNGTLAEARLPHRMNQDVRTSDSPTFVNMTLSGNLTVSGTRTYVNTTTLDVGDNIITLNADLGAVSPSENAGIEIMRGTSANVQFMWDETNDRWTTNNQELAVSSFIANGAVSGITTLAAGNTTITGFANVSTSVNAASHTVGSSFIANSSGITTTGFANVSTTLQVGSNTATFGTAVYIVANGNVGIGANTPNTRLDVNGNIAQNIVTVAASAVDCSLGNYFIKTAAGALTWTATNVPATRAYSFILELTNGGTGTQTWYSGTKWPGGTAPTLVASGVDVLGFITDDGGTTWRGVQLMKDSK